jgi:SAM-dependent methyltransferase
VSISADQERGFYDAKYRPFLALPDEQLAIDQETFLQTLEDPAQPAYERRVLHRLAMNRLLKEPLGEMRALEYGCGPADWGLVMASEGAQVALVDLSTVAIEVAMRRARASGIADRVEGFARDASDLSCFRTASFDLIFAAAALHHTLKYPGAYAELLRVLKPGGRLYLVETFGGNRMLNLLRRLRARIAHEPEEQGEGIILDGSDIDKLRADFDRVEVTPVNLLAMLKRCFRGRFESRIARGVMAALEAADRAALRVAPGLGRYCGEILVVATRGAAR